jgi:hypothetical protein
MLRDGLKSKKPLIIRLKAFEKFYYLLCGPDGTRTRDLRRDRAAF